MENSQPPKLEDQLCFPIYVIAKEITGMYRPFLEELDLTYPQYLVMMILWEKDGLTVTTISEKLFLDSGTITPLLKRLENKGIIVRKRKNEDERVVEVYLTEKGQTLQQNACLIPAKMQDELQLSESEIEELKKTVNKILIKLENRK